MATKKLQILGNLGGGSSDQIYVQSDEPTDAPDGALWLDLDEEVEVVENDATVLYTEQILTSEQKAQVRSNIEALGSDGTIANALALNGKAPEYYLTPVNLLVNSNFSNPLNTNGQTSYTGSGYTIDQWIMWNSSLTANFTAEGVTLVNSSTDASQQFVQYRSASETSRLTGKPLTFAVGMNNGNVYAVNAIGGSSANNADIMGSKENCYITLTTGNGGLISCAIYTLSSSTSNPIKWAALYEGTYTAETLPPYVLNHPRVESLKIGLPVQPVNLLDNSDFRKPVMQAGFNGAHGTVKYIVDRWKISGNGTFSRSDVTGMNMQLSSGSYVYIYQLMDMPPDGAYTLATYSDNTTVAALSTYIITGGTLSRTSLKYADDGHYIGLYVDEGLLAIQIVVSSTSAAQFAAALMCEGTYTAETLPPYVPKPYAVELAECQRYYENSWFPLNKTIAKEYIAQCFSATGADTIIPYKQTKRVVPTATFYPDTSNTTWMVYTTSYFAVQEVNNGGRGGADTLHVRVVKGAEDTSTWTRGQSIQLRGHWEVSADL